LTHRNAYINAVGTLAAFHMTPARSLICGRCDVPLQRLDLCWIVTAVGRTHICLPRSTGTHLSR